MPLTYAVLYAASCNIEQYRGIFEKYDTSEFSEREKQDGVWGEFAITFHSLAEFDQFANEIGPVVIGVDYLMDGSTFRTLVIYDGYLE